MINGEVISQLSEYRSLIGYVPQDDVMNPLLTVRENIAHSALMRLPKDMAYNEKMR
jgi:ABC-type multidrug transport system ATPase subunit